MITLQGGHFQSSGGTALRGGSISFQINIGATVIAPPSGQVVPAEIVKFQLDANGNIQDGAQIYSNAELNPQTARGFGTFYLVTIYNANGAQLNKAPMMWQFMQSAGATVDISQMKPYQSLGSVIFYPDIVFGPGGGNHDIQFNQFGSFNGSALLQWDPVNFIFSVGAGASASFGGPVLDATGSAGTNGQTLSSTGTATKWVAGGGGGAPGGSDKSIQFNNSGAFGGDTNLIWDSSNQLLAVTGQSGNFMGAPFGKPTLNIVVGSTSIAQGQPTPITFAGMGSLAFSGESPWWLHAQSFAGPVFEVNVDSTTLGSNFVLSNNSAGSIQTTGTALVAGDDGSFNLLNKNAAGDACWLIMAHSQGISLQFSGSKTWNVNLDPTTGSWYPGNESGVQPLGTTSNPWASLILGDATPSVSAGQIGYGNTTGVGNGSPVTAYSAPALGTGSGPADPGSVVLWEQVNVGGTVYWRPLYQ